LVLVVVDICSTECMLVLVALDTYFCLMLTLRSADPQPWLRFVGDHW
jgi:hypothetical protein